mgnify:FL=1
MFRGKNYKESAKLIDKQAQYEPQEAFELITKTAKAKFDETVELHVKLGVDSRHADQQVRGAIVLPHGTGKVNRVLVFCKEEQVQEALDAGADYAGGQDLVAKIQGENWFEFDTVIASPNMMGVVGRLGKVLGPKGLMPSPKAGTVTPNIANAIKEGAAQTGENIASSAGAYGQHTAIMDQYDVIVLAPQVRSYYNDMKADTDRLGIKLLAPRGKEYIDLTRDPAGAIKWLRENLD